MRRRLVFAVGVGVSLSLGFIACGLDEDGRATDGGADVTLSDATPDTKPKPDALPGCDQIDATACVDAAVPDGWKLALIGTGDLACPNTVDFTKQGYLDSLTPTSGCSCNCT